MENHLLVHQMDALSAFLHGMSEDEMYLEQAEGSVLPGGERLRCKLRRSLYGLKQLPR